MGRHGIAGAVPPLGFERVSVGSLPSLLSWISVWSSSDGSLLPTLLSLLSTHSCCLLLSEWMEGQMSGTYHTVELGAHLSLLQPPPAAAPSTVYACALYQSYCTSDSSFPIACELQPATLQTLWRVLESAQTASPPAPSVPASAFDALFDELCCFLLDHFPPFLKSSELVYSGVERVLLAPPGSGPQELMFSVARRAYCEELPLFILDFHAAQARFRRMLPPRLVARIKQWEADRRNGKAIVPAAAAASTSAAAAAASSSSSSGPPAVAAPPVAPSFAPLPSLDDGYDIDPSAEHSWVLSGKHQRLLDEGTIPKETAVLQPRPELPVASPDDPSIFLPPVVTPVVPAASASPPPVSLSSIVSARLCEIQVLYEKYLQPSSSSQQKHMLQSALVAMAPRNALGFGGASTGGLKSGTSMTASHPLFRRAEFPIADLPYYLLRNFLDHFHMSNKYGFLSEQLESSMQAIKLWVCRDVILRRNLLKTYYQEMHLGCGVELGLAHGIPTRSEAQLKAQESEGWVRGSFDPAPKPPRSRPPSPSKQVREALQASAQAAARATAAASIVAVVAVNAPAPPPLRRAYSDGGAPQLAEWIATKGIAPLMPIETAPPAAPSAAKPTIAVEEQKEPEPAPVASVAAAATAPSASSYRSPVKPRFVPARSGGDSSFAPPHTRVPSATLLADGSAPLLQLILPHSTSLLSPANSPRIARTASPSLAQPLAALSAASGPVSASASSATLAAPSDPLLPALPFLPPQRSFRYPTVAQYRKHVMELNKRLEKAEQERAARREARMPPSNNLATNNNSATSSAAAAAASADKNAASSNAGKATTPRSKPKRLQFGGNSSQSSSGLSLDAPLSPAQASSSVASSSAASSAASLDDRFGSTLLSPHVRKHRSVQSGDDLDLFMLRERAPHLLPVQCADADAIDTSVLGDGARKRQLFEQIQSMRSVQDTATDGALAELSVASAPPSPALPPRSLPSSPALGSQSSGGVSLRSAHNTPRAVRFPAVLRHEVREFDADVEAAAVAEKDASKKKADKKATPAPTEHAVENAKQLSVTSSPSAPVRSILKQQPSRSLLVDFDSALHSVEQRNGSASVSHAGSTAAATTAAVDGEADSPSPDPVKSVPRSDSASNCLHSPVVPASGSSVAYPAVTAAPSRSILVSGPTYNDAMRLIFQQHEQESARLIRLLQQGATFWKFHFAASATTMPSPNMCPSEKNSALRFLKLNDEATEISWAKLTVGKASQAPEAFSIAVPQALVQAGALGGDKAVTLAPPQSAQPPLLTSPSSSTPPSARLSDEPKACVDSIESDVVTVWRRVAKGGLFSPKPKSRLLADALRLFPDSFHSAAFLPYNARNLPPWLCLSLVFSDRSYDLVALSSLQARQWFFGLQALCPLNPTFKSPALYQWHVLKLKVQYHAKENNCTIAKYCRRIITVARANLQRDREQAEQHRRNGVQTDGGDNHSTPKKATQPFNEE